MNVEIQKLGWCEAYAGYEEARSALREHPEAKHLKLAARAYYHMKKGRGVLDVFQAIKKAGLNADSEPRLAIAPSDLTKGCFRKSYDGTCGYYYARGGRWDHEKQYLSVPEGTFPNGWRKQGQPVVRPTISSPCPIVPPKLMPPGQLQNYFTMWEVDHWDLEPPADPLLLQRISTNLFVVLASWDTTPLERSILRGMYQ